MAVNQPQITNYTNLQSAIIEELNRQTDSVLVARVPDFIYLFEQDLRAEQEFTVERYSIANAGSPLPITQHPYQLPDYVRFVKSMRMAGIGPYRHPLTLVTRADMWQRQSQSLSGNWNQMAPGIPIIAVVEPQAGDWMGAGGKSTGIGPWLELYPSPLGAPVPGAGGATATATITNGQVTSVAVTAGGSGYDVNNPPGVMFLGGGPGSGAAATVTIAGGAITAVTVTNQGSGYTSAPTVAFASVAIDLVYIRDFVSIVSDPNGTNGILRLHPSVYLYGSLLHTAPWLQHDDRLPVWQSLYDAALKRMNKEMERAQMSDVPKRARFKAFHA